MEGQGFGCLHIRGDAVDVVELAVFVAEDEHIESIVEFRLSDVLDFVFNHLTRLVLPDVGSLSRAHTSLDEKDVQLDLEFLVHDIDYDQGAGF